MPIDVEAGIISNTRLSNEYNVVALAAPEIAARALPGQFVMVKPGRCGDPFLRRPFSIFEVLRDESGRPAGITLLNKAVGPATRLVFDLEKTDRMACLGPLGRPFQALDPPGQAWMVAGGVGLAPFVTLAESLRARGAGMTLFYGGRRAADLYYLDLFERIGARLVLTTEDGSRGERGLITAPLRRALHETAATQPVLIYACGPTGMMRAVAQLAGDFRRDCQVSLEPVMGCGLGGCYSCVVPIRTTAGHSHFVRSCIDGPVFPGNRIAWDQL